MKQFESKPGNTGSGKSTENMTSAFVKDPKIWNYLRQKWNHYVENEDKDWNEGSYYGYAYKNEIFDVDPTVYSKTAYGAERRYTLVNQEVRNLFKESAKRMHGVDFFDEISKNIEERRKNNDKRPISILITGGDIAFFNDELRSRFGKDISVFGTTLDMSRTRRRKKRFVELIRKGEIRLPGNLNEYLGKSLSEKIDPRDHKWHSILEIQSDKPEFDKIIDTCGELLYSYDEKRPEIFEMTFRACISKLKAGGKLYIAEMKMDAQKFVERYCKENNLTIEKNDYETRQQWLQTNFIITKRE